MGQPEPVKVYWLSPRLMSLLDYFMHKAPYWSVNNYEKRVDVGVRTAFLRHVEQVHADNRRELTGMCVPQHDGRCLVFGFHCITLFDDSHSTGWAEIWESEVESNKGQNVSASCKNPSGQGLMEDAISKMMGKPKSQAEPAAEANVPEASQPANGAAGAPAQPPAAAAASPLKAPSASAEAAASPTKQRAAAAAAGAAVATPSPARRGRAGSGEAANK